LIDSTPAAAEHKAFLCKDFKKPGDGIPLTCFNI
jgi:hypothetical protein